MAVYFEPQRSRDPGWGDYLAQALTQLVTSHFQGQQQRQAMKEQRDFERENRYEKWGREDLLRSEKAGAVESAKFVVGDPEAQARLYSQLAAMGVDPSSIGHLVDLTKHMNPNQLFTTLNTGGKTFAGGFNQRTGAWSPTEYINTPDPTNVYVADRNLEGTKYTADSNKAGVLGSAGIAANSANARSARELAQRERLWNIERGDPIPSTGVVGDDGELRYVNKEGKMVRTGIFPKTPPQPQGANVDPKTALGLLKITRGYDGNVLPGMENLDSLLNQYAMDILKPTQPQQQPQQQMGPPTVNIPGFSNSVQNPFRQSSAFIAPEVLSGQISAQDYQILSEKYTPQQITAMVKGAAAAKQKKKK